ncbi:hypothetical protein NPIL_591011 [Nephila pilipes]|uniref:Uncharacterized protein n=1 Tax=Nephila pilipes TaxID=299642 RepID=A0A8X6IC11_NEPPI|nr:hypothetical protein NPIL_591011 [Nephila pilipes]
MNRKLWKCCGKPFTDLSQYTDHILFDHDKNADCKRTDSTNRNDRTTLDESQDSCSKQIKIPKKTTRKNEYKKDVAVVDSIRKSNDSNRKFEKPTKSECKKNIALVDSFRSLTDSNKLFKESTIESLNRELDDNILHESVTFGSRFFLMNDSMFIKISDFLVELSCCQVTPKRSREFQKGVLGATLLRNFPDLSPPDP